MLAFYTLASLPATHKPRLGRQALRPPERTDEYHLDFNDLAFGTGGPLREALHFFTCKPPSLCACISLRLSAFARYNYDALALLCELCAFA